MTGFVWCIKLQDTLPLTLGKVSLIIWDKLENSKNHRATLQNHHKNVISYLWYVAFKNYIAFTWLFVTFCMQKMQKIIEEEGWMSHTLFCYLVCLLVICVFSIFSSINHTFPNVCLYKSWSFIHQTKPAISDFHHLKYEPDLSTNAWEKWCVKRTTNFWTPCSTSNINVTVTQKHAPVYLSKKGQG